MREGIAMKLGGTDASLLPTFQAYADIERRLGQPLRQIYTLAATGMLPVMDMATVVTIGANEGMLAGDRPLDLNKTAEVLYSAGIFSDEVLVPVVDYLAALGWTPEQRRKIAAAAEENAGETTT